MSELKIQEHIVETACCWTTVSAENPKERSELCAHKITFDRAYPFIWVVLRRGSEVGIALTKADAERAVVDDEIGQINDFDFTVDGVTGLDLGQAFCIACGARKTVYLLPKYDAQILIAAQEDTVCPLTQIYGWA